MLAMALLPAIAFGQGDARARNTLHDVAWYRANPAERMATLRACHGNAAVQAVSYDCDNAERAEAAIALAGRSRDPLGWINDPAYYRAYPWVRDSVLQACAHPELPGNQAQLPYCAAARAAKAGQR